MPSADIVDQVASLLSGATVEDGEDVSFAGRKLKLDTANDANEIVDAINAAEDMKSLCLEGNTLGLDASIVIAEALKSQKNFKRALWSDIYTGRLRSEIPPSLQHLGDGIICAGARLMELDLSDNAFGPDGVKGIKKLLMSESCYSLKTLKLNNNGLGIGGGKILSQAFIECHKSSTAAGKPFALKVFISGRNRLENEGARALSKAFTILGSLEEITMPQNGIRKEGVADLAAAFQANKNLKVVNINDNTCTLSGAKAIAKCLPHLKNLETLNVGDCLLKDSGAAAMASALAVEMPNLKNLIMSFNEIRRDGALAITRSMKNKSSLTLLNLDGNQLGEATDEIEELMTDYGRISALEPFEENEEPDSDDDNDDADGADEEEGDTSINDQDDSSTDNVALRIEGMGLTNGSRMPKSPIMTNGSTTHDNSTLEDVRTFLSMPSTDLWEKISKSQRKSLIKTVVTEDLLPYADKVSHTFVQTSHAMQENNAALQELAECILGCAFDDSSVIAESLVAGILVYMGLLKSEVKIEKIDNIKGPLRGLDCVVMKEFFPRSVVPYLIAFLMKPNNLLDGCQDERHNLLAKLHQK